MYPTAAADLGRDNWAASANWSRVLSNNMVQEIKGGYYHYHWFHAPATEVPLTPLYRFPSMDVGARGNIPEEFWQDQPYVRYDLSWTKGSHDFQLGGEYLGWRDTGWWLATIRGNFSFAADPSDLARRFPLESWDDASAWDLSGLDDLALDYTKRAASVEAEPLDVRAGSCPFPEGRCGNWTLNIPRKTYAAWLGDTWRVSNRLTVNYGVRYDLDWGGLAPPNVIETELVIDNGLFTENLGCRNNIRDLNNWSPRGGFNWDVSGTGEFVIRGASGLYYAPIYSNIVFNQQLFNGQRVLGGFFPNDGLPGFVADPTRGLTDDEIVSGAVPLPPQSIQVLGWDPDEYQFPMTWQTTIGFQQQLGDTMSVEADLIYYEGYWQGGRRDANLFYDPANGFNQHPTRDAAGNPTSNRPRNEVGPVTKWLSNTRSDNLSLATGFSRRYRDNFQFGVTYTLMFYRNDGGTAGNAVSANFNNVFDIPGEFWRAFDFQRNTVRANGLYRLPYGFSVAGAYLAGSGNNFQERYPHNPLGVNRVMARTRPDGSEIPRSGFNGNALHKVDLRGTKEFVLGGGVRLELIAEVFNVFNHANFGSYSTIETTANFGEPLQNVANTYLPRTAQFAFRINF